MEQETSTQPDRLQKIAGSFEDFMAALSARFVALPPEQVDGEIQDALEECRRFFGFDRIALVRLLPSKTDFIVTHDADVSGVSPYPTGTLMPVSIFPWFARKLIEHEVVSFGDPEMLPAEANTDKQTCKMFRMSSALLIPIAARRSSEYTLGTSSSDCNMKYPVELISRFRLLGELFVNAHERSKVEQELRESEERLTLAVTAADAGLWIMDMDRGIVWETKKFRELLHFTPDEELTFERYLAAVHPDDHGRVQDQIRESLERRKSLNVEYRIMLPDGGIRWIASIGNPSPSTSRDAIRLMGVSIDVTSRKEMEIELRDRLDEIQRLKSQLEKENIALRDEIKAEKGFEKVVGDSNALSYVLFRVKQVAPTDATVLILGETGTGKSMVANALHEMSPRKDRPMITVNCAALPANLVESELFGREKGAFTGAQARQAGRFEIAHGGTIFLDEIGEMPLEIQAKLLRVLQDGEFERLGSPRTVKVDVRVIASTARDLKEEVANKRFREDLYYRLNVFPITMPPLRLRTEDIPHLVRHFIHKYARKMGRTFETVPKGTMRSLQEYQWPGNVRELEHVIERAVIICPGPELLLADRLDTLAVGMEGEQRNDLESVEREHILKVLVETWWKIEGKGGAAAILGLNPSTLRFRIRKLGIERP